VAGFTSVDPCTGVLLAGTALLNCKEGVIGATVGAAYDTLLFGVYIQFAAGPPTLTIGGMADNTGTAQNLLISGSTTLDYFWMPPSPILNNFAAFTFTPSVTLKIWVFTRDYRGPERPGTRVTT
jgi:hypothetical protein